MNHLLHAVPYSSVKSPRNNLITLSLCLALFLSCAATQLRADELQKAGDMESPKVTGKQSQVEGGDPTNGGAGPGWKALSGKGRDGVEAGLTDALAHGGKQALYVTFTNATKPYIGAVLTAEPVPVTPGNTYTVSAWGRLDAANPVSGQAVAKAEVVFLEADGVSVSETRYVGKPLSMDSGKPFFDTGDWQELTGNVRAPENAASVRVRWVFQKETNDDLPVSGTAYFDDFSITSE
jgi:hypothetical protein